VLPKKKTTAINAPELHSSNSPEIKARCIHFYSCIAAFSGDSALAKEFARFISDEQVVSSMQQVIAILGKIAEIHQFNFQTKRMFLKQPALPGKAPQTIKILKKF
jgi:hypothetical protein